MKNFIELDYEKTCLIWIDITNKRMDNNEWKWNYYYLLYYLDELTNDNITYVNKRLSQIVREHKIKPLPFLAGNINIHYVLTISDINIFCKRDAEKYPLSINYDKLLRIGYNGNDIGYEIVLDSKLIVSKYNNHLKYNSDNSFYNNTKPYNYLIEQAKIDDCICFDPNSVTFMSLIVCLIIVIPIDKRCYRELIFNKLTNVTNIQLMRLQQLSIESMLNNRNTSLLNRIHVMIGHIIQIIKSYCHHNFHVALKHLSHILSNVLCIRI